MSKRHAGFQLPQIAPGQPVQVLVQIDHAQRVDRGGVETAVEGHHARTGREDVVGHGLEHRLGQPLVDGAVGHVETHGLQARLLGPGKLVRRVRGHHHLRLARQALQTRPVGRAFQEQQNGLRFGRFGHLPGHAQKRLELFGETYRLHGFTASSPVVMPPGRAQRKPAGMGIAYPQGERRDPNCLYTTGLCDLRQRQRRHDSRGRSMVIVGVLSKPCFGSRFGQRGGRAAGVVSPA